MEAPKFINAPDEFKVVTKELIKDMSVNTVFVSGSHVEGFANTNSDVDVFIVQDKLFKKLEYFKKEDYCYIVNREINNVRFDFEIWEKSKIDAVINMINQLNVWDDYITEYDISHEKMIFIHKMITAIPVYQNDQYHSILDTLNQENYYNFLSRRELRKVDGAIDDLMGMVEDKQYLTALLRSRGMIDAAVDSYSFANKISSNPNCKWRMKYLDRSNDAEVKKIKEDYLKLLYPDLSFGDTASWTDKNIETHITACIEFSHEIIEKI